MNLIFHLWFYIIIALGGKGNTYDIEKPLKPKIEVNTQNPNSTQAIDIVDIDRRPRKDKMKVR